MLGIGRKLDVRSRAKEDRTKDMQIRSIRRMEQL